MGGYGGVKQNQPVGVLLSQHQQQREGLQLAGKTHPHPQLLSIVLLGRQDIVGRTKVKIQRRL